jgi:hypothetical protein
MSYIALKPRWFKTVPVYPETALVPNLLRLKLLLMPLLRYHVETRTYAVYFSISWRNKSIRNHWCCRVKSRLWNYVLSIVAIAFN